jgi:hypothetical protein
METETAYKGQFTKRSDASPDDGRDLCDAELRKLRPQRPDSLAKASSSVDDEQIRKMLMTSAERRENGTDALDAVRKIHARGPDGSGLALPTARKSVNSGARLVTAIELETMVRKLRNLRKDSRVPPAVRELPPQSSNGVWTTADPSRAGATDSIDGYRDPAWPSKRPEQATPPHSASITSRRAGPQDSDIEKPLDAEPDSEADLARDRAGALGSGLTRRSVEAVRRDLHPSKARMLL